jgi:hypothetical protein
MIIVLCVFQLSGCGLSHHSHILEQGNIEAMQFA